MGNASGRERKSDRKYKDTLNTFGQRKAKVGEVDDTNWAEMDLESSDGSDEEYDENGDVVKKGKKKRNAIVEFFDPEEESIWTQKIKESEKEEKLIRNLEHRVYKTSISSVQEQIGNEEGVRQVNQWQAHMIMKERECGINMFVTKAAGNEEHLPHYLNPHDWHSVILQFVYNQAQNGNYTDPILKMQQEVKNQARLQGVPEPDLKGITEKSIDRFHFLMLLHEIQMTKLIASQIEKRWDSRKQNHLTKADEPMLVDFESCQVLGTDLSEGISDVKPMITVQQCMRLILERIINNATKMERKLKVEEKNKDALMMLYNAESEEHQKDRLYTQKKLAAKKKDNIVMAGRKRDLRMMVMVMREYIKANIPLKMDDVYYLEWQDYGSFGGWQMRRNWAWEFLIATGVGDLVRPLDLLGQMRTNTLKAVQPYMPKNMKENESFTPHLWIRQRLDEQARKIQSRVQSDRETAKLRAQYAKEAAENKKKNVKIFEWSRSHKDYYHTRENLKRAEMANALAFKSTAIRVAEQKREREEATGVPATGKARYRQRAAKTNLDVEEWELLDAVADIDLENL